MNDLLISRRFFKHFCENQRHLREINFSRIYKSVYF